MGAICAASLTALALAGRHVVGASSRWRSRIAAPEVAQIGRANGRRWRNAIAAPGRPGKLAHKSSQIIAPARCLLTRSLALFHWRARLARRLRLGAGPLLLVLLWRASTWAGRLCRLCVLLADASGAMAHTRHRPGLLNQMALGCARGPMALTSKLARHLR